MLPEFVQAVENVARDVVNGIHTAIPGKVLKFDTKTCTATIQPVGKYILPNGEKQDYPQVTEVPFCMPYSQAGGAGVAIPVKPGDSCLILFSEIELDEWRTGAEADVEESLKFDLTNAVAIPGLLKKATSLTRKATEKNAVVVSAGDVCLTVSKSGVSIDGNLSVSGKVTASHYDTR